jgi:hypothetical protein
VKRCLATRGQQSKSLLIVGCAANTMHLALYRLPP